MATAKLAVKESLLRTTRESELSTQTKATFDRNARQDNKNEELFMTEEDFINAIAPKSENYVSLWSCLVLPVRVKDYVLTAFGSTAQNKTRAVCYLVPCRRSTKMWEIESERLGVIRESACQTRCRV